MQDAAKQETTSPLPHTEPSERGSTTTFKDSTPCLSSLSFLSFPLSVTAIGSSASLSLSLSATLGR